jgi:hypothetical protein
VVSPLLIGGCGDDGNGQHISSTIVGFAFVQHGTSHEATLTGYKRLVLPQFFDCDLNQLSRRLAELDAFAQAVELEDPDLESIRARVFILGGTDEDHWNSYHLVRNEFDRRAAEEFDLGQ